MEYRLRNDVILEEVCGVHILIALKTAREHCPYLMELNNVSAFIWKDLQAQKSIDQIVQESCSQFAVSQEVAEPAIRQFIKELTDMGYILEEEN